MIRIFTSIQKLILAGCLSLFLYCQNSSDNPLDTTTIPIPQGIEVAYDTAHQVVTITWKPVRKYAQFQEYSIIRGLVQGKHDLEQVGYTQDTVFYDTISFPDTGEGSNGLRYEYAVQVTNSIGEKGYYVSPRPINVIPYKEAIPKISNLKLRFDTLSGVVHIKWDAIDKADSNSTSINIHRDITDRLYGDSYQSIRNETFTTNNLSSYDDSIFHNALSFDTLDTFYITYKVCATNNNWNLNGHISVSNIDVLSYKVCRPIVRNVSISPIDISSDVVIKDSVWYSYWPITKMEWMIGDNPWVESSDGVVSFATNRTYTPETIICIFRATDSVGNQSVDTVRIYKSMDITTYPVIPDSGSNPINFKNRAWLLGAIEGVPTVWSTDNFWKWNLENATPGVPGVGKMVSFNGKLTILYMNSNDSGVFNGQLYQSEDGINWDKLTTIDIALDRSQFIESSELLDYIALDDQLFASFMIKKLDVIDTLIDTILIQSTDGVNWTEPWFGFESGMDLGHLYSDGDFLYVKLNNTIRRINKYMSSWETFKTEWDSDQALYPDSIIDISIDKLGKFFKIIQKPEKLPKNVVIVNGTCQFAPIPDVIGSDPRYPEGKVGIRYDIINHAFFSNRRLYWLDDASQLHSVIIW